MGTIPGISFKTNVQDEDLITEIVQAIEDEFDNLELEDDLE